MAGPFRFGGITGASILVLLLVASAFGIFSHLILPVGAAVLAVAIPVLSVMAVNIGVNPAILVIPIAFTASCVFLIPLTQFRWSLMAISTGNSGI